MFIKEGEQPDPQAYRNGVKTIRVTERQTFKKCRRAHDLSYIQTLEPTVQDMDSRGFGTLMHSCLAEYYMGLGEHAIQLDKAEFNAREKFFVISKSVLEEYQDLGRGMLEGYFKFAENADKEWRQIIAVEHTFTARVPGTNVNLSGTVDLLIKDRQGRIWLCDHKTYTQFLTPSQIQFDDQQTAYMWLLRQNGIYVHGAIYNMLRKKTPTEPQLLKNGTLSKNKALECDSATYMTAIKKHGLCVDDYTDMLLHFENQPPQFFQRVTLTRSERTLQSFEENLPYEAREMTSVTTPRYPHFSRDCPFCDFNLLCRTMTDKGDVNLARTQFKLKEKRQ